MRDHAHCGFSRVKLIVAELGVLNVDYLDLDMLRVV